MNTMRTHGAMVGALAAGLVVLAGCSGRPTVAGPAPAGNAGSVAAAAAGSASQPNPCALLTQAEVDTAVGQPLRKGNLVLPNDCDWTTSDFAAGVDVIVGDWAANVDSFMAADSRKPTVIPAIGDQAFDRIGSGGSQLYFRSGDNGYSLIINGPHIDGRADQGLAAEKILAVAMLTRIR